MSQSPTVPQTLDGPVTLIRNSWKYLLALGVLTVVLGVLVLAWPGQTLVVVGALFGVYLLVSGIVSIVTAFGHGIPGGMRALGIISGALSLMLGAMAFRGPLQSIVLLSIWIGIGWLFTGITQMAVSLALPSSVPGRGWAIFAGILLIFGGLVIVAYPLTSIAQLTLFAGIWLIVVGIIQSWDAFRFHRNLEGLADTPAGA